jgi:hypothetical protein
MALPGKGFNAAVLIESVIAFLSAPLFLQAANKTTAAKIPNIIFFFIQLILSKVKPNKF